MFDVFIKTVVVLIIALVVIFLIWLITFLIQIARDEIAMQTNKKYFPGLLDIVVNNISNVGLLAINKIYQLFKRSK